MKNILNKLSYRFYRKIGVLLFDKELNNSLNNAKSILLINWNGKIGDSIISSFIFRELKKKTNFNLSIITTKDLEKIYKYYNADNIYIIKKNHSIIDINNIANEIKKIDIIIPLIGTLSFNDLYLIKKLNPLYVFSTDQTLKLSNKTFLKQIEKKTITEIYHKILEFIKVENINNRYSIPFIKNKVNVIKYDILFNPFGSRSDKSLSINKSVSILKEITKIYPNFSIAILYSPKTKYIAQSITKRINHKNVILAENIFTIENSIELISKSHIVISVDTSIVHIAVGMNKKVISIYYQACDNFNVWLPQEASSTKVIYSLGKTNYKEKDMNNFSNSEIINQIKVLRY